MIQSLGPLAALLLSAGLLLTGNGLFGTLVAVHMSTVGVPIEISALVLSGYYLGLVGGSLFGPQLIERVGHIRAFAAFAACAAAIMLVHPVVPASYAWLPLRILTGLAMAGLFVTIESWLNERADPAHRGALFSVYMIVNFAASFAGQLMLNLAPPVAFTLFNLTAILTCLAVVPISAVKIQAPPQLPRARPRILELYRISPVGIIGTVLIGLMNGAFTSLGPIYASETGLDVAGVSAFMASTVIGGLLFQWPIGWLSDHRDRRRVLALVAGGAIAMAAVLILLGGQLALWQLCLAAGIYGGFVYTLYPVCVAHAQDFAGPGQRVAVSGGLLLAFGVGAMAGPVAASPLMAWTGPRGLFLYTAGVAVVLCSFAVYRMTRRAGPEVKTPFVARTTTSPGINAMDPHHAAKPAADPVKAA